MIKKYILIASCLFLSNCTIIGTSEVGIKSTLGKISEELLDVGVHFYNPFISSVKTVSLKQHQETSDLQTQTSDLQPATIKYQIMYSIPAKMVIPNQKQINGDLFDVLIKKRADESIRDTLAQYPAESLIVNRDQISQKVKLRLIERTDGHAEIDDVAILGFDFANAEWKEAVDRKVRAKQDSETAVIKKQQAQAEADQILIKAKAEAEAIKIKTQALSSNSKLIDLTIAEKWNGVSPTTVMISDKNTSVILPIK